jgi:hypothetical protein
LFVSDHENGVTVVQEDGSYGHVDRVMFEIPLHGSLRYRGWCLYADAYDNRQRFRQLRKDETITFEGRG